MVNKYRLISVLMAFFILIVSAGICYAAPSPIDEDTPAPVADQDSDSDSDGEPTNEGNMGGTYNSAVSQYVAGTGPYGTLKKIADTMFQLAFAISLFKIVQIGIMFMTGIGKKSQEAKAALVPWVIGVVVCATYLTIGNTIINAITSGMNSNIFG